eukprot:365381-Chlamydomonas_euryale.AAC.10
MLAREASGCPEDGSNEKPCEGAIGALSLQGGGWRPHPARSQLAPSPLQGGGWRPHPTRERLAPSPCKAVLNTITRSHALLLCKAEFNTITRSHAPLLESLPHLSMCRYSSPRRRASAVREARRSCDQVSPRHHGFSDSGRCGCGQGRGQGWGHGRSGRQSRGCVGAMGKVEHAHRSVAHGQGQSSSKSMLTAAVAVTCTVGAGDSGIKCIDAPANKSSKACIFLWVRDCGHRRALLGSSTS